MTRTMLGFALVACGGDDTTTPETDTTAASGFTVSGRAALLLDPATAAAEGLCVDLLDPTPALAGGEPTVLGSTTVGADGSFTITDVTTTSTVGLLMAVAQCPGGTSGGVLATATGIEAGDYDGVAAGTVLDGYNAYVIDAAGAAMIEGGLAAAGYTGDLAADGSLLGFVLDPAGLPVDGAAVSGGGAPIYYATTTGFDTTATVAAAGALFVIPAAPIYTYGCSGGGFTYAPILAGSQPGFQVVVAFNGM